MSVVTPYLVTPIVHVPVIGEDVEFERPIYGTPDPDVLTRIDGKKLLFLNGDFTSQVNVVIYLTDKKITARDLLDGQVVLSVNTVEELDGSVSHYESAVGVRQ